MDSGFGNKIQRPKNPRENASCFSVATFLYTLPTFLKGYKQKNFEVSDLYETYSAHKSGLLGDRIEHEWEREVGKAKKSKRQPSLRRVLIRIFGAELLKYGLILAFSEICIRATQPLALGVLLAYFVPNQTEISKTQAYCYATWVVSCSVLKVFFTHPQMLGVLHIGMKMRVACCSLIYRKALRLNQKSLKNTTAGQIVNLLSNDVIRFDTSAVYVHQLWIAPCETLFVSYFMYREVGISALAGVFFLLLLIPFQFGLGKRAAVLRLKTAIRTDERIRLMNEIVKGIQVIKMYAWEIPFAKLVALARRFEIQTIRKISFVRGTTTSFIMFSTRIAFFLSILTYVLLGNMVQAKKVFVLTAFYNILRQTMGVYFPQGIAQMAELNVSVKRLTKFMMFDERDSTSTIHGELFSSKSSLGSFEKTSTKTNTEYAISIKNGVAKWSDLSSEDTIRNLNLRVKSGSLIAIIGPVGSGKSSVFNVILNELPLVQGTLSINGEVSYASQEPWLFPSSVRQNITFGNEYDRLRYRNVMKKCALERDFSLLPFADKTIVGERGISLSGGQRARINLARAVYKQADIYLLDDPLSAVDTHVGKQLFEQCIQGYLKDKTVILVTHQLQYLKDVDKIYIMEDGIMKAEGTFTELQASGLDFARLLNKEVENNEDEDEIAKQLAMKRRGSLASGSSLTSTIEAPLEVSETKGSGSMSGYVYKSYFLAGGNLCVVLTVALLFVLAQLTASIGDVFITYWVNLEQKRSMLRNDTQYLDAELQVSDSYRTEAEVTHESAYLNNTILPNSFWNFSTNTCIYTYTVITVITVTLALVRSYSFFLLCMRASIRLHDRMFESIINATMRFFNTNTSGRILNRFSKDMGAIDELLPIAMIDCFQIGLTVVGALSVVGFVNVWLIPLTIIMVFSFYKVRIFYLGTSQSIKRLEGVTRSIVFACLNSTVQGLTTIRAFGKEALLEKEFDTHQDLHSTTWFLFIALSKTFALWLDLICCVYIGIVTYSFLIIGGVQFGGNVGLAITQSIGLTGTFQWGMRQSAEMENQMTAVERVLEYTKIEHEPPLESDQDSKPPTWWPDQGRIQFTNLFLKYFPQDPPILRNLNITIEPLEKIGIVGRTGAGKSSLVAALFRLTETEGSLVIDGISTKTLGLHDLRSKISIIPQEPVLFSGTMRKNLDPFDEYDDSALWKALEDVELKEEIKSLAAGLNSKISEGGSNFSVGQRQLVCLARAILRNNKILVLDEATANVDPKTDELIQTTIRKKFNNCTVLTIAHRLHTVMDSDKVLVMDAGKMVEFDHPYILLQNKKGVLYSMVQQTGTAMAENLIQVSQKSYQSIHPTEDLISFSELS